MFKRIVVLCAIVAVVATGLVFAGGQQQGGSQSKGPITVGISLPLTGDLSQPGGSAKRGYEVWAELLNKNGGLLGRQVKLNILDDASSQSTIVSDYNRLITQDKVDLLLGTFSSLLNFPASAVAEKHHMVYVEPAGGAPKIFTRGFKYLFFAQPAPAVHQADLFSKWVLSLPANERPKTAAYPTRDDPFTKPVIEGIRAKLEAGGIKTVYQTTYPTTTTNFDTIAAAIKASGADLVAEGAVFQDGVSLIRSMQKINYNPKVLFETSAPSESQQFSSGIGVKNTQGIFYAVSWSPQANTPDNKEFVSTYKEKFGELPPEDAADAFGTAQALEAAVKAVGSTDQNKIKDWLHAHTVNTVEGKLSWDQTGRPQEAFLLAQWQNGASQIVFPKDLSTSNQIVFPKPNWQ